MIRENYIFRRLYHKGRRLFSPCLTVYYLGAKNRGDNRLGITATKKIGGAVTRNRARRVILEAYRLLEPQAPGGLDIVIVARPEAASVKMQVVQGQLSRLFKKMSQRDNK